MKLVKFAVAAAFATAAGVAGAATQGDLSSGDSAESQGSADVIVVKDNAVRISNLADFDFGTGASSADLAATSITDSVCVFSSTGDYSIEIASANGFELQNEDDATTTPIEYSVSWGAEDVETTATLTAGTPSTTDPLCGDANGADADLDPATAAGDGFVDVTVDIVEGDFYGAEPGTYSDTLTFTVTPV